MVEQGIMVMLFAVLAWIPALLERCVNCRRGGGGDVGYVAVDDS